MNLEGVSSVDGEPPLRAESCVMQLALVEGTNLDLGREFLPHPFSRVAEAAQTVNGISIDFKLFVCFIFFNKLPGSRTFASGKRTRQP
jgi:hypothetical protein